MISDTIVCLFCLKEMNDGILIFGSSENATHARNIIVKYFWFDVNQINYVESYVCFDCWFQVKSFHEFYLMVEAVHNRNSLDSSKQLAGGFGENVIELENGILTPRISESDIFHDKNPSTIEELSKRLSEICSNDLAEKTSYDSPLINNDKVIEFVNDILAPLISDTQPIHDKSLCPLDDESKEPNAQYPNDISERVSLELPLISDEKVNELVNDILAPHIPESGTFRDKSLWLGELSNLCSNNVPERTLLDLPCIFNDSEISNGPGKDIMAPQNCPSQSTTCQPNSAILEELNKSINSQFQHTSAHRSSLDVSNAIGEKSTASKLEPANKKKTNIEPNNEVFIECPNIVLEKGVSNKPAIRIVAIKTSESESIRHKSPLLLEQLNKGRNCQKTAAPSKTIDEVHAFNKQETKTEIGNVLLSMRSSTSKSRRHEERSNSEISIEENSKIELNSKCPSNVAEKTLVDIPCVSSDISIGPEIANTSIESTSTESASKILASKTSESICDKKLRFVSETKDNQHSHSEEHTQIDAPLISNEDQVSTTKNNVLRNQVLRNKGRRRKSPSNSEPTKKPQLKIELNKVHSKNVSEKDLFDQPLIANEKESSLPSSSKLECEILPSCAVQSQCKPTQSKRAHRKSPHSLDESKKESNVRQNVIEEKALLDLPLVFDEKETSAAPENKVQAPEPKSMDNKSIAITKKPNVQENTVNSIAFEKTLLALPIIFEEKINSVVVEHDKLAHEPEKVRRKSPNLAKSNKLPNEKVELKSRQSKIKAPTTNSTPPKQTRSFEMKQTPVENQPNKAEVNGKRGRPKITRKIDEIVCFMCHKSLKSFITLRRHFFQHEPDESRTIECKECKKKFLRAYLLRRHMHDVHEMSGKYWKKSHMMTFCPICEKQLTFGSLRSHIATTHENKPRKGKMMACKICRKEFKGSAKLAQHLMSHADRELTQAQCDICGKWVKNRQILYTHKLVHDQSPKKCPHCDKVKLTVRALRGHIAVAHSTPKHKCHICNKSFTRPKSLREHLAIHTGESLYNCSYCTKTFKSNANMYKHMKEQHLEQWNRDRAKNKQK